MSEAWPDYYDIDGNPVDEYQRDPASRRIALDDLSEDVRVSTVHLVLNHQWMSAFAPLIFETMVFGGEQHEWRRRWATKENAAEGHRATVAWLLGEGPEPAGDGTMTRTEWEARTGRVGR